MIAYLVQNIAQVFMIKMGNFYDSFSTVGWVARFSATQHYLAQCWVGCRQPQLRCLFVTDVIRHLDGRFAPIGRQNSLADVTMDAAVRPLCPSGKSLGRLT
jgi:hypothetical protein